ncbi:hypothetical protein FN846DRAFT_901821 [Sphaerosporella brunnea]|uniref:Uncharacterized protein n=1 Tax=Sphaerosporella brunnea TaxID=1250544 RepID=A0A5J5FCE8_9PEZI|nr:hypothetical protein FN846DRAFT_901821 [Sphaerosporella brunnea]
MPQILVEGRSGGGQGEEEADEEEDHEAEEKPEDEESQEEDDDVEIRDPTITPRAGPTPIMQLHFNLQNGVSPSGASSDVLCEIRRPPQHGYALRPPARLFTHIHSATPGPAAAQATLDTLRRRNHVIYRNSPHSTLALEN